MVMVISDLRKIMQSKLHTQALLHVFKTNNLIILIYRNLEIDAAQPLQSNI